MGRQRASRARATGLVPLLALVLLAACANTPSPSTAPSSSVSQLASSTPGPVSPSLLPSGSLELPSVGPSPRPGMAVDCGPLRTDFTTCFEVLGLAAGGISSDVPVDQISVIAVIDGAAYPWCAPPDPCVSPPPQSYWVEYRWAADQYERIPVYSSPDLGWQLGVPPNPDAGSPSPSPNLTPGEARTTGSRIGDDWERLAAGPLGERPWPVALTAVAAAGKGTGAPSAMQPASARGSSWVAVGSDATGAVVVTSKDGIHWTSIALPGGKDAYVASVAVGHGMIVVGGSTNGCCGVAGGRALLWTSTDGTAWKPVADSSGLHAAGVVAITSWSGGFVAVGVANATESGQDGAVWTSVNGRTWTRRTSIAGLHTAWLNDVAATGRGLVIVGTRGDPNVGPSAAWTSSDGIHWALDRSQASLKGAVMKALANGADGLVAIGQDGNGRGAAWTSSDDGSTWRRASSAGALSSPSGEVHLADVVGLGTGYLAIGGSAAADGSEDGGIWSSSNGLTWHRIATSDVFAGLSGGNGLMSVGVAPGTGSAGASGAGRPPLIAVVGGQGDPDHVVAGIWISPPGP